MAVLGGLSRLGLTSCHLPIAKQDSCDRGIADGRKFTGPQYNEAARAWRFSKSGRATSAIEYQIRGHGSGVVILKAVEHYVTAKQDDGQQAVSKIGELPGTVLAHSVGIPGLADNRSALCGRPCEFNFHAGCARPCE
jgi:hypothetical protein